MKTYSAKSTQDKNKQISVLSVEDFLRIRNTIVPPEKEEDERKRLDQHLKTISQTKMRQWPDSIEMAKKNKLESRKKIFFEKEMEKRSIDEAERKFQEKQKQIVIERANKLLFDAQDPVKSFNSKMLLSDVLKERDYQKDIKNRKIEMESEIERKWLELERQTMLENERKAQLKKEDEMNKKKEQMKFINQQFHDYKVKRIKEYQDAVIEGEMIKLASKQALDEERKKEEGRRDKNKKQQGEFLKANQQIKFDKENRKLQEKEEEKIIEQFAIKKQEMVDLRKFKEAEKFKDKQDRRQKMIDRQSEYLKSIKNKEEELLSKQIQEAEEKKAKELEEKNRKMDELKKHIIDHRNVQIQRKQDSKIMEKLEEKEFIESWKDKMKSLEEEEKAEKEEISSRNKNLQNYHKLQMEIKKQKAEDEFIKDQEDAYKTNLMLQNEQDEFMRYADQCIGEYHGSGKNLIPLILDLKNYKKKAFYG